MNITETWSISHERIAAFFSGQEDIFPIGDGRFSCGQCEIRLSPLPLRQVGRFYFPQTQVEFDGPEADADAVHRRFVLQFISAGG